MLPLFLAWPGETSAQRLHGFATFGVHEDINKEFFPGAGGGVVLDFLNSWASAGGQGDLFFSNGYVSGRGGPIGQFHFIRQGLMRPFATAGYVWGEVTGPGPTVGGGLEFWSKGRFGFRADAQVYPITTEGLNCAALGYSQSYCDTYLNGGRPHTSYPVSVRVGISWR
jgi:hypothetical protein